MSRRSTGLAVRNDGPPIALLRASIGCFTSDFLFPSLRREGIEGWVQEGLEVGLLFLSWPSGMTALLPFGSPASEGY